MKEQSHTPNPAGKHAEPFSLAPMKFDEAHRKILAALQPKRETKPAKI